MDARQIAKTVAGVLVGVLGATFGIYCGIKNTKGRVRSFMTKFTMWCIAGVLGFLLLLLLLILVLPHPYKPFANLLFLVYVPALIIFIVVGNRRHRQIREEEAQDAGHGQGMAHADAAKDAESTDPPSPALD